MKALEELTREIREKLPRLKILESGQKIKSLINDRSCLIEKGQSFIVGYEDCNIYTGQSIEIAGYVYDIVNDFEIVGKKPMLNDVLEWYDEHVEIQENNGQGFYTRGFYDQFEQWHEWDMSKPYLKDQSPELINFLHGLIKK